MDPTLIERKSKNSVRVSLNNLSANNALEYKFCANLTKRLVSWSTDRSVEFVILDHAPEMRVFCAGMNMEDLAFLGSGGFKQALSELKCLYRLLDVIANFPKPIITFMDGRTCGAGVGLSILGSHQVATENTAITLPQTGLGFFPDAGATWYLPRLPGEFGTWMALTGARVVGFDAYSNGLSSHYCSSSEVSSLKRDLIKHGLSALNETFAPSMNALCDKQAEVDHLFAGACVTQILKRLDCADGWARQQAKKIRAKSPLSTKIALRQIRTGNYLDSVSDALRIEYRIGSRLVRSSNFSEGVRAMILDKDYNPKWRPPNLLGASKDLVAQYFSPVRSGEFCSFAEID